MLIKGLWDEWMGNYAHSSSKMAWLLLVVILLTPLAIAIDIIGLPIEILYCISYKIIRKIRSRR